MEGLSGGGGTISAEFLQNIQTAVDSSGVIGKVQVIETDEGPMTVIFMEEGADASALTNSQIFTDAGLTVGNDANIQYTVTDNGDLSHTQIQYVDDAGNPVDPLQYGIDSGDGTQVQYQFIESAEDYTGFLENSATGTVSGETNQTSQDGNAVAVDPVFSLDQYVTNQQTPDELSTQQHVPGQHNENVQVPGPQSAYQQVLNQTDAYQQIQGLQASNPQVHRQQATYLQVSNEQATGPSVSDNETLLQATGVGGETLYITESGEIIKIDTSLLSDSQYSTNGGGTFYETNVGNITADEQFVATKILADQLGNENVLTVAQPHASSSVHFSSVPSVSRPRFVTKPGVRTNQKQSYKRKEVGNNQPAVGRSVLPTKTATSFNLMSIDNTQNTSKNESFLSPHAAKQLHQVLTFKSNDKTYIITSVDSHNAANMGVGMQTKPKHNLATIKPQLTSQTCAMRKHSLLAEKPAVTLQSATNQRKPNATELDKGTMTSISPLSKVQTMKSPDTSSVTSASIKKPILSVVKESIVTAGSNQTLSASAMAVKGIITSKPTTFMPQVSKLLIAGTQTNKTDVNKCGIPYTVSPNVVTDVKQQIPTCSDVTPEVDKSDNQSQTGVAHSDYIEVENLTVTKETTQTVSDLNLNAVLNGDNCTSVSINPNNSTVVNNTHVDDNFVTATDVLSNTQASSAVIPVDGQGLENSENNKDGGIDDASELQTDANSSQSIKTVTDSSETNNIVPFKLGTSSIVTNTTEYKDLIPNGLEMYTPIFHSYQCGICSEEFKTETNFNKHHLQKHTEKLTCLTCNQNFRSGHILNNHMTLMHTMGKPLTCPDCNLGFLKSSLYWAHAARHACVFKCNPCQKIFNSNVDLQRHLVDGHIEQNLKCVQCGQVFRSREELNEHELFQHNMVEQKSQPDVAEPSTEVSWQEFPKEALSPADSEGDQSEMALYIDSHEQLTQQQKVHPAKTFDKPPVNVQVMVQKEEIEHGKTLEQSSSDAIKSEITKSSQSNINQSSRVDDKQSSLVSENKQLVTSSPQMKSIKVPDSDVTIQLYADGTLVTSDKSGTNYSKMRLEDLGLDHTMLDGNTNIELLIVQGDGKEVRAIINTNMQSDILKTDSAKKSPEVNKESQDEKKSHVQPPLADGDGIVRVTADDPRPYKCSMCPRTFKFYRTFKCHEIVHSKAETYTCPLCKRLFARESNLESHLQLHEKKAAMQRHTSTNGSNHNQVRDGKLWHCEHCGMSFTACTNMLRHIRQQHDNITGVACLICDKRFLNEASVQRHTKTHLGPFPCSYCDSQFDVHDELADHLKEQHREKLFSCKFCEKVWLSKKSLITHVSEHHGSTSEGKELLEDLKKFECEECGLKFVKKFALTRHILVHTIEGSFQCIECPKKFDCQWKLTKHQKTHETPTIHECLECIEKFKFPHFLEKHKMSYHQGPYLCSECKEEFSSRLNLEDHQYEKHDGGFTCTNCSKKLRNSLELDRHSVADHSTGTSSFKCEHCEESFEHKAQLKMHLLRKHFNASKAAMFKEYPEMRTVHDELTCEICDAYCKNKTVYKQHFKDDHFDGDAEAMYEVCPELKMFPDPPDPVVCDHCGKSCTNLMYLNMHLKVHGIAANNKEKKDRDDSGSSDDEDIEENEMDFTNIEPRDTEKPYKCKECGENFARQAALKKHAKSHEKDYLKEAIRNMVHNDLQSKQKSVKKAFDKSFDSSAQAKSPKRKSSMVHIVCGTCKQVFKSKAELKVHRKAQVCGKVNDKIVNEEIISASKTLNDACTHKCKCCDKSYVSAYNLKRHLEQIHNMTLNSDDLSILKSDKGFGEMTPKYSALKKAQIVASNNKTDKASSHMADYGSLLEDGTDISTFLGKNFNLGKTPSSPCNIESVKKKCHKCSICGKGFSREATLKKHLLLHEEGSGSHFDMKPDRRLDFMADWKKALYPCANCGNMYSTAGGLIYHSRLRHPDVDEDAVVTKIIEITDKLKADKMGLINNETKGSEIRMAQKRKLIDPNEKPDELDKKKIKIDETGKSTFPCQHCDAVYKSSNGLSFHMNACHADKSEPASEGNASSAKQRLSGRVIVKNSKYEQQVRCSQCTKLFDDISNLRRHVTAFHKDEQNVVAQKSEPEDFQHKCEHCNKKFLEHANLRRHLKMKHNLYLDDSVTYCPETKDTKSTVGSSAVYDCDVCEQKFSSLFNLRNHMLTVHDEKDEFDIETTEKTFECSVCHREFASKKNFDIHMRKHTGEKPYECSVCSKKHICKSKLELHLKKNHRKQWLRKIKCKICLFLFDTEDAMMKHKVVHRKEVLEETTTISTPNTYKCLKCDKLFRWKRNLVSHARIFHRDSDPLTCGICNKVFPDKESIMDHLKEHHEQKHTCEICMKSFSRKSELKQHEAIAHKGTVSLSCDICKQSFVTKQKLLEHMLSHTSIMPHKCDICSVSFKAVHLLKAHKLRHKLKEKHLDLNLKSVPSDTNSAEIKPNAICKKCDRKFSTEWSLKVHVAKAHRGGNKSSKQKVTTAIEIKDKVLPKTESKENTRSKVETKQRATKSETIENNTTKTEQKSKSVLKKATPLSKLKSTDVKQKTKQHSKVAKTRVPPKKTLPQAKRNIPLTKMKSPALKIKAALQKKALSKKTVPTAKRSIPASKQKTSVHHIVKSIKHCDTCNLDFASYKLFKKHCKHTHGIFQGMLGKEKATIDLMCPICETVFSSRQNLKRHLKIIHEVHSVKPLSSSTKKVVQCIHCSECTRVFWYKDQFELHLKKAHPNKSALQLDLKSVGVLKKEVDDANLISHKQEQPGMEKMRRKCEFCSRIHWTKKTFEDHLLNFHPEHAETYGLKEGLSEEMPEIELVNDSEETNKYLSVHLFENTPFEKLSAYPVVLIERMPCGFGLIPMVEHSVKFQNEKRRNVHKSDVNDNENAVEMTVKCVPDVYKFDGTVTGNDTEQLSDQNENAAEKLIIENVRSIENVDKISESEDIDMLSIYLENEEAGKKC